MIIIILFMMFFNKDNLIFEEDVKIKKYGDKISKKLDVFYNPVMKLNRDVSLLVIKTYFEQINPKKIKFCDPMGASGIREIRFLKNIPEIFDELFIGDISKRAILEMKRNFKINKIPTKKIKFLNQDAINTINYKYYDFIEIDPFGSPVPFLDVAFQRIKHNGVVSVTATDTAALCGTYPKTTFRRYGVKVEKTLWFEELGLRNLIAYCQRQAAKYELVATPILSYSKDHYYKIFFKITQSRTESYNTVKKLSYISWNKKTQETRIKDFESENTLGKTYIGNLNDKEFIKKLLENINILKKRDKVEKLLNSLLDELDIVGYYNPHKFEKEFKFSSSKKFEQIIEELNKKNFKVSRPHNNRLGIKTDANFKEFIEVMKN
jgi:tRNA (guanine26-N2/guanine27-N2)-dimethyltransferase